MRLFALGRHQEKQKNKFLLIVITDFRQLFPLIAKQVLEFKLVVFSIKDKDRWPQPLCQMNVPAQMAFDTIGLLSFHRQSGYVSLVKIMQKPIYLQLKNNNNFPFLFR